MSNCTNITPSDLTCNGRIFQYEGDQSALIVIMILCLLVLIVLFIFMFKLCCKAFSYSNYHIHQTYNLYALCILALVAMLISRKTQLDHKDYLCQLNPNNEIVISEQIVKGSQFVNNIFGIISIFTVNYAYLYNSFTWLTVALSCDFAVDNQSIALSQSQISQISNPLGRRFVRKRIDYIQKFVLLIVLPLLQIYAIFATISIDKDSDWCWVVATSIVISSYIHLSVFIVACTHYFIQFFGDNNVSKLTKGGLIYLLLCAIVRSVYFTVVMFKRQNLGFSGDATNIIYVFFCILMPILIMSKLSQTQLQKQQFQLLKRSLNTRFQSTII